MGDCAPTCLRCPNRSVGRVSAAIAQRQVLCEYEGWISPRSMRDCEHLQQVTRVRDAHELETDPLDDEIADGERLI